METNCSCSIMFYDKKHVETIKSLFEKISVVFNRNDFDSTSNIMKIGRKNFFFSVDLEPGCGANVIEYVNAIDYILRKNSVENISFQISGYEDLGYDSYNAFIIDYENNIPTIRDIHFDVELGEEDDFIARDDAFYDAKNEAIASLENADKKPLESHRLMFKENPINTEQLDTIDFAF